MGRIPRPLLRVTFFAFALLFGGCAQGRSGVVRVVISERSCAIGCRAFSTSFSNEGSSATPAFETGSSGDDNRALVARAFKSVPLNAVVRCVAPSPAPKAEFVLVGVHLTDGTNRVCAVPWKHAGDSNARAVRAYAIAFGWPIYRSTLAGEYRALERAIASDRVGGVVLQSFSGGATQPLTVRFNPNGTATFSCGVRSKTAFLRARIPFQRVMRVLREAPPQSLLPSYPHASARARGAVVTILLPHDRLRIGGPDSTTWEPPMTRLVAGLERIAREALKDSTTMRPASSSTVAGLHSCVPKTIAVAAPAAMPKRKASASDMFSLNAIVKPAVIESPAPTALPR